MAIQFNCSRCGQILAAADGHAGVAVRCPKCKGVVSVPKAAPPPPLALPVALAPAPAPAAQDDWFSWMRAQEGSRAKTDAWAAVKRALSLQVVSNVLYAIAALVLMWGTLELLSGRVKAGPLVGGGAVLLLAWGLALAGCCYAVRAPGTHRETPLAVASLLSCCAVLLLGAVLVLQISSLGAIVEEERTAPVVLMRDPVQREFKVDAQGSRDRIRAIISLESAIPFIAILLGVAETARFTLFALFLWATARSVCTPELARAALLLAVVLPILTLGLSLAGLFLGPGDLDIKTLLILDAVVTLTLLGWYILTLLSGHAAVERHVRGGLA